MKRLSILFSGMMAALLVFAAPARAELIVGSYNFTLGSVVVSLGEIDWTPPDNPGLDLVPTYGSYEIQNDATRTGVFLHTDFDTLNEIELIQDMSENPADANHVPQGLSGGVPDFFIIAERPNWNFTETFLAPGQFGTPFLFTQGPSGVSITINLQGIAWDDATPALLSSWSAVISSQYVGWTIDELFNCIIGVGPTNAACNGGMLPENSWSGTFVAIDASIPEPVTLLTFGAGALFLAYRRRRQARRS